MMLAAWREKSGTLCYFVDEQTGSESCQSSAPSKRTGFASPSPQLSLHTPLPELGPLLFALSKLVAGEHGGGEPETALPPPGWVACSVAAPLPVTVPRYLCPRPVHLAVFPVA